MSEEEKSRIRSRALTFYRNTLAEIQRVGVEHYAGGITMMPAFFREHSHESLDDLREVGEDVSGLYLTKAAVVPRIKSDKKSYDGIGAHVLRSHCQQVLERFDPDGDWRVLVEDRKLGGHP